MRTQGVKLEKGTFACEFIVSVTNTRNSSVYSCSVYTLAVKRITPYWQVDEQGEYVGRYDTDGYYSFDGLAGQSEVNRVVKLCRQEIEDFKNK